MDDIYSFFTIKQKFRGRKISWQEIRIGILMVCYILLFKVLHTNEPY